ncbi:MAG: HEAT repeat domain-containing protein [Acidobacteriota bacterium]
MNKKEHRYRFFFLLLLFSLPAFSVSSLQAVEKQSLYEKVAVAELIVLSTIVVDDAKYVLATIDEILKGTYQEESIQVSFRKENFESKPGEDKITFRTGERAVLFLEPAKRSSGKVKKKIFTLIGRAEGKLSVSEESITLLLDAIKRFVRIQALKNQLQIWDEHKKLLEEKNHFMVEAGLQEIVKFRTADPNIIPQILEFSRGNTPRFRLYSMLILRQLFEGEANGKTRIEGREEIVRTLREKARRDEDPSVRIEAIRAIKTVGTEDDIDLLETISRTDKSQDVRYEAQKVLYEMKSEGKLNK